LLDLLKRAAEASLVFGAVLYVIGWSYLDAYYGTFGLKVSQLGISSQEVAISSFHFIFRSAASTAFLCLAIVGLGLIASYVYGRLGVRREILAVCLIAGLVCAAGVLSKAASVVGKEAALNDLLTSSTTLPRVEVEVDRAKVSDDLVQYRELASKEYRLVLQTDSRIWLFKSVEDKNGFFRVVNLPKEAVRVMTTERPKVGTP